VIRRLVVAASLAASAPAIACELPAESERFESSRFRLALATSPATIEPGQFFVVLLAACAKEGAPPIEALRIDAHMPDHRHGMNYAPRLEAVAPGAYRAEGLLFHMPGRWEFIVELRAGGSSERATLARRVR